MTEQEFAIIVKDTKRIVLSAVEKHLPERFFHAIDDVVQETYLRAYRHLIKDKFRGDSLLSSWLYEIAKNESFRMGRRLQREEEKAVRMSGDICEVSMEETPGAESGEEDIERMRTVISGLPSKYREVLELVSLGHSEKEIAARLDIRGGTVKSRLSRGRELLSRSWKGGEEL